MNKATAFIVGFLFWPVLILLLVGVLVLAITFPVWFGSVVAVLACAVVGFENMER